jgi:hypothetical protein
MDQPAAVFVGGNAGSFVRGHYTNNNLKTKARACSYGKKLSRLARKHFDYPNNFVLVIRRNVTRLPGKVFGCDVALNINWIEKLLTRQKVIPLSGKVVFILWGKHYPGHRDLACQQARSRYTGKLFVSYERNVTFHIIFVTRRDLARKLVETFSR